ncbi:hypothetical protein ACVDG3_08725 [Meridianimarinicoccus sp. RP-17]|uniref:hypothetical protein n=1 Tax=Meridianimarinicoccus zhengii TaxID=2056810 RepID=UPI000DAC84FD|nr:hypothetical protein [Phycocomes zhengii]
MLRSLIMRRRARVVWPTAWPASVRLAAIKAGIVLVPSYTAAWLTDKMVYVVPTLAAAGIVAAQISFQSDTQRRTDEESDHDGNPNSDTQVDVTDDTDG